MKHQPAIDFILNKMREHIPARLKYHSPEHTLSVIHSVRQSGAREGINGEELQLLLTAAAYHDAGFLNTYKNHEEESCAIARRHLPKFDFTKEQIEKVCGMIMATKVPQSPSTHLEKLLCDADLEYLGGDDYHAISNRLYEELQLNGHPLSEDEWKKIQINFLLQHHYWTDWAIKNLTPNKHKIIQSLQGG